jgi:hypothetical protein
MAEIWGAAIVAGGAIYSASKQAGAAKASGNASERAAQAAIDQSNANYDRTKTNLDPYITAGNGALTQMQALNNGDFSSFKASPDYQFTLDQGVQASDRGAAARGSLYSGGHSADLMALGQGLASQQYGNYYNRLSGLAGMGQSSATSLGSIGTGNAAQAGQFGLAGAAAQGNAAINGANVNTNLTDSLTGILGKYLNQNPVNTSSYGDTSGNLLTGGTYTGNGSLSTTWPGQNNTSWGPTTNSSAYPYAGSKW